MSNDKLGATFSGGEEHEIRRWGSDVPIRVERGLEIDVRPHPAARFDDTQVLKVPAALHQPRTIEGQSTVDGELAPELPATLWPDGNTTGAFISAAASIRHEVKPYRWWNAVGSMALLYSAVIGVPLGLIAFAVYEIYSR